MSARPRGASPAERAGVVMGRILDDAVAYAEAETARYDALMIGALRGEPFWGVDKEPASDASGLGDHIPATKTETK